MILSQIYTILAHIYCISDQFVLLAGIMTDQFALLAGNMNIDQDVSGVPKYHLCVSWWCLSTCVRTTILTHTRLSWEGRSMVTGRRRSSDNTQRDFWEVEFPAYPHLHPLRRHHLHLLSLSPQGLQPSDCLIPSWYSSRGHCFYSHCQSLFEVSLSLWPGNLVPSSCCIPWSWHMIWRMS